MKELSINYDVFIEKSTRNIIKSVIKEIAKNSSINFSFEIEVEVKDNSEFVKNNNDYCVKVFRINNLNAKNFVVKNSSFSFNTVVNNKLENMKIMFNSILRFNDDVAGFEINFGVQDYDDIENDAEFNNILVENSRENGNINNTISFETLKKIK